jgi:hypothetical protein
MQPATRRQRSALNARVSEPRTFARRGRTSRPKRALLPLKHRVRRRARASRSSAGRQPHRARVLVFDNVGCRVRPNASFALPSARSKDPRRRATARPEPRCPRRGIAEQVEQTGACKPSPRVDNRAEVSGGVAQARCFQVRTKTLRIVCSIVFNRLM